MISDMMARGITLQIQDSLNPGECPELQYRFQDPAHHQWSLARIKAIPQSSYAGKFIIETNAGSAAPGDVTTERLCIDQSGIIAVHGELKLNGGLSVGEFSGDATLGTNNDRVVPTQRAVRAYVEGRVGPLSQDLAAHSGRIDQLEQRVAAKAALGGSPAQDFQARSLTVSGVTTLSGGLRVAANQATTLGGTLVVSGATTLSSLTIGSGNLSVVGDIRINDKNIWFRGGNDPYHGLGFHGTGKEFAGQNINGPVLYGNNGGGLGARIGDRPEQQVLALRWTGAGNVGIGTPNPQNTLQLGGNMHMDGHSIFLRSGPGDQFDVIKWNSAVDRVDIGGYAGVNLGYTSQKPDTVTPVLTVASGSVGIRGSLTVDGSLLVKGRPILTIQSGEQSAWGLHQGNSPASFYIPFSSAFKTAPRVQVAIRHLDADGRHATRCSFEVADVTPTGFTLRIVTWADTFLHGITATWIAYGEAA